MGQKNLSPWQEMKPWPPVHTAGALSTELWERMENKVISLRSYMYVTGVLRSARISNVKDTMSSDTLNDRALHEFS